MKLQKFDGYTFVEGGVCAAQGFLANGIQCGLAHKALSEDAPSPTAGKKKHDLAVIYAEVPCAAAAVYTTNKVKGAPILVTREHLKNGTAQAVIVNSVNANTCNPDGVEKATKMCQLAADALKLEESEIIVASTGVIGQVLPIEPIAAAVPELCKGLNPKGNAAAVEAIMTTDTMPKEIAVSFTLGGKPCKLGGMLKGSGMIHPNMATTLTFLTTDADIAPALLQQALSDVVKLTLNRVSVDGDTSTNDMVCVLANGKAGNAPIRTANADYDTFKQALYVILLNLARMMARDGEGATKLITCLCEGAPDEKTAEIVAKSVITSSLVKTAMFGKDANWGRIACAAGYAQADFDLEKLDIDVASENGRIAACRKGVIPDFSEEEAARILEPEEIRICIHLNSGLCSAVCWGCDLTYDYVKINGDYRS